MPAPFSNPPKSEDHLRALMERDAKAMAIRHGWTEKMMPPTRPDNPQPWLEPILEAVTDEWLSTSAIALRAHKNRSGVYSGLQELLEMGHVQNEVTTKPGHRGKIAYWRLA